MGFRCSFEVLDNNDVYILIKDLDRGKSITNDAEWVVGKLLSNGLLVKGKTLYYIDTDGRVDVLNHDGIEFTGFSAGFDSIDKFDPK